MDKPKKKYYVGCKVGPREVFRYHETPSLVSHGGVYSAVIGPFRTKRGAEWMADSQRGLGNPHCRTVADAERLAKKYATEYNGKGWMPVAA
jgi:hypothetical protein